MKKIIYIAAAALVALASCTKNEVANNPAEISFKAVAGKNTKAALNQVKYPEGIPFGVFAYYTQKDQTWATNHDTSVEYMNDIECKFAEDVDGNTENYVPATVYYWPLEGALTFVAYSPYTATADYVQSTKTLTISDFSLETTLAAQTDLMYTKAVDAADKTNNEVVYDSPVATYTKNGVQLQFRHALSQLRFFAKADKDYAPSYFNINKIELKGAANKGNLVVVNDDIAGAGSGWTMDGTTKANFVSYDGATGNGQQLTTDFVRVGEATDNTLVIPQTAADDFVIEVTYTMWVNGVAGTGTNAGTKTVKVKVNKELAALQPNKIYNMYLIISAEQIKFSPEIVDWDTAVDVHNYDIPEEATV